MNKKIEENTLIKPKNSTRTVILCATCIVAVLFMLLQIVTNMLEQNAIAKTLSSNSSDVIEKNKMIDNAMKEAQQQMGDDFYKAASGGAPISEQTKKAPTTSTQPQTTQTAQKTAETKPSNQKAPAQKTSTKKEQSKEDKMVTVNLAPVVGRQNPFVPAVSVGSYTGSVGLPQLPKSTYPLPPTELVQNEEAEKLMRTTISGIMFDALSPSAIVSVEGQDHLVRKGDRINGYKILNITKDRVIVQNGTNVYRATVGETLTTQNRDIHFNTVDNLRTKFAGANATEDTQMIEIN